MSEVPLCVERFVFDDQVPLDWSAHALRDRARGRARERANQRKGGREGGWEREKEKGGGREGERERGRERQGGFINPPPAYQKSTCTTQLT